MRNEPRQLLGKSASFGMRQRVYQTAGGFDVEMREQYEVMQRRVLFDDVQLVTMHRRLGALYLILTGGTALLFATVAIAIVSYDVDNWPGAMIPAGIGLPFLILFAVRLALGQEVITIFGRRSKAEVRFSVRKRRARETYGKICAAVREAQRRAVAAQTSQVSREADGTDGTDDPPALTPPPESP